MKKRIPPARTAKPRRRSLALPGECTLAAAEGLKLRLMRLLTTVTAVTVDVRRVRRIDTASMQLLAVFVRDRATSGRAVRITGDSAAFAEACRLLGLGGLLGAPAAAAAG
ncbi:MAG TPA: STAS domain-containing protein [Steroidobacteraceae bacterium]|nr:STAS domain-containing protein [Steroidobacteraceae bacterium]